VGKDRAAKYDEGVFAERYFVRIRREFLQGKRLCVLCVLGGEKCRLVEVSSDYCGGGEFPLGAAATNCYGNLNTLTIKSVISGSLCECHSIDIFAKDVVIVGGVIVGYQIQFEFSIAAVIISISQVVTGGGNHCAFIGGRKCKARN